MIQYRKVSRKMRVRKEENAFVANTVNPPYTRAKVAGRVSAGSCRAAARRRTTHRERADAQINHHPLVAVPCSTQVNQSDDGGNADGGVDEEERRSDGGDDLFGVEL